MELLAPEPLIELYDPAWPILTQTEQLPPARLLSDALRQGSVTNSLLSGGVVIRGATVANSVLGSGVQIGSGCVVLPNAQIGAGCHLHRVIVESGMRVPDGTVVSYPTPVRDGARPGRVTLLVDAAARAQTEAGLRSVA